MTLDSRSKFLALLLRHKPELVGLILDKEGWCSLDQLLAKTTFTLGELEAIVRDDAKGRYSFKYWEMGGESMPETREPIAIRANQGHSTTMVDLKFKVTIPPPRLFHGTLTSLVPLLLNQGLHSMSRQYVHLSTDYATAKKVGARRGRPSVLAVDCVRAVADGVEFSVSDNGVWQTKSLPPQYLSLESDS